MAISVNKIGANETVIITGEKSILISYETPVAAVVDGKHYRTSKKWSSTTSKHINRWLPELGVEEKPQEFFDNILK